MNQTASAPILTTDGIPLKVSLKKVERKNKIRAFLLVLPLLAFILVTFLVPIADMLTRSIDDRQSIQFSRKLLRFIKNGIEKIYLPKNFTQQCFLK